MQKYANIKLNGIGADGKKKSYALSDFQGEKVVVYFYPKDETSYCTKEACDFRDNQSRFGKLYIRLKTNLKNYRCFSMC